MSNHLQDFLNANISDFNDPEVTVVLINGRPKVSFVFHHYIFTSNIHKLNHYITIDDAVDNLLERITCKLESDVINSPVLHAKLSRIVSNYYRK